MATAQLIHQVIKGLVITGGCGVLTFMGYGIVNNDVRNTQQHIEIRKEVNAGDIRSLEKVDRVKDIVTDIRIEQTEQRVLLQEIRNKL